MEHTTILKLLNKCYKSKLQCQSKALYTSLLLNTSDTGLVNMDYNYYRDTLPLKDYDYFKECLGTLYKYKWLIKDNDNNTFINTNI